ncbi:CBS domain-containing protein, partial [Amycolatopsis rhizosphaerae]
VAGELMTHPPVTIEAEDSLVEGARRMAREHVKQLPVVDRYGKLVGIVSRSDLLRIFVRTDEELREEVVHEVFGRVLWLPEQRARPLVAVADGVVTLTGELERASLVPIAVALTRRVPGVVDVVDRLTFTTDDTVS